jgi:hypothetical protein
VVGVGCRVNQEGNVLQEPVGFPGAQQRIPIRHRHQKIGDHERGWRLPRQRQSLGAVGSRSVRRTALLIGVWVGDSGIRDYVHRPQPFEHRHTLARFWPRASMHDRC